MNFHRKVHRNNEKHTDITKIRKKTEVTRLSSLRQGKEIQKNLINFR